jgi:hypothetical protein
MHAGAFIPFFLDSSVGCTELMLLSCLAPGADHPQSWGPKSAASQTPGRAAEGGRSTLAPGLATPTSVPPRATTSKVCFVCPSNYFPATSCLVSAHWLL